jgi:pimeloyl-ACP methyl ester carboxylesterase
MHVVKALRHPLVWSALAVVLVLPVLSSAFTAFVATAFLVEFLSGGGLPVLSSLTRAPAVEPLPLPGQAMATLYRGRSGGSAPLVLVHGLAPLGRDDPRLRQSAQLLARAGFRVAVPTVRGLTGLRLRPEDAETVVAAIEAVAGRTGAPSVTVIAVSVGAGPALLAAADPRVADRVGIVLSLGGYASTVELLRYFLTGHYRFGAVAGTSAPNLEGARLFLRANLDLVEDSHDRRRLSAWLDAPGSPAPRDLSPGGAAVVALVENRDPARVEPLIHALPPALQAFLDMLSPERVVAGLRGRLLLVHGRDDPAVPFTESLRLAEAARRAAVPHRLVVVGVVKHVEGAEEALGGWRRARELTALWTVVFDVLRRRD